MSVIFTVPGRHSLLVKPMSRIGGAIPPFYRYLRIPKKLRVTDVCDFHNARCNSVSFNCTEVSDTKVRLNMFLWTPWREMVGRGITLLILNFDIWWRSLVSCTFQPLCPREERTSAVQYTGFWAGRVVLCHKKDIARNRTSWSSSPLPNQLYLQSYLGPIHQILISKTQRFLCMNFLFFVPMSWRSDLY